MTAKVTATRYSAGRSSAFDNPGHSQDVIFEDWSHRNPQAPAIEWAPEGGGLFDVIDASSGNLYIKTPGGGTAFFLASQNIPP